VAPAGSAQTGSTAKRNISLFMGTTQVGRRRDIRFYSLIGRQEQNN